MPHSGARPPAPAPAQYMSAPQHPGGRPPVQYFGAPSHAPVMRHPSNAGARPVQYMQHQPIDARAKALKQLEAFEREEYLCPWWAKNGDVNSIAAVGKGIAAVLFQTPERPPFRREVGDTVGT
ncbi:hypothetical protein T484DRAFT_1858234 [Baffinella frigidus]|nr:hypothetical protein T484DRAFT_1858234 [Cryptophyta sp. CCMP2293]